MEQLSRQTDLQPATHVSDTFHYCKLLKLLSPLTIVNCVECGMTHIKDTVEFYHHPQRGMWAKNSYGSATEVFRHFGALSRIIITRCRTARTTVLYVRI